MVSNNSHTDIDWEARQTPTEIMPLLAFFNKNFIALWVSEPTWAEKILNLVFISRFFSIVEDIIVSKVLRNGKSKMVRFTIKVSDISIENLHNQKFNFKEKASELFALLLDNLRNWLAVMLKKTCLKIILCGSSQPSFRWDLSMWERFWNRNGWMAKI